MVERAVRQVKRLVKIFIGFALLLAGAIMWFTPGPGWAAVAGGLAVLATEFAWARRWLDKIKAQGIKVRDAVLQKNPPDSPGPPS